MFRLVFFSSDPARLVVFKASACMSACRVWKEGGLQRVDSPKPGWSCVMSDEDEC